MSTLGWAYTPLTLGRRPSAHALGVVLTHVDDPQ